MKAHNQSPSQCVTERGRERERDMKEESKSENERGGVTEGERKEGRKKFIKASSFSTLVLRDTLSLSYRTHTHLHTHSWTHKAEVDNDTRFQSPPLAMAQGSDSNDTSYKSPSPGSRPVSVHFHVLVNVPQRSSFHCSSGMTNMLNTRKNTLYVCKVWPDATSQAFLVGQQQQSNAHSCSPSLALFTASQSVSHAHMDCRHDSLQV